MYAYTKYTLIMEFEVFDIETQNVNGRLIPLALSYSDGGEVHYFYFGENSRLKVCEHICDYFKSKVVYYAHNLIFDVCAIITGLVEQQISYDWVYINDELYEVTIYYKKKVIILRCSYKLISFGLQKLYPELTSIQKMYFPYECLSAWDSSESCKNYPKIPSIYSELNIGEYLAIYSINDSKMLKEGLGGFFSLLKKNNIDFNKKSLSIGGVAFNFYKKN